jgi:hypothetical protein
VSLGRVVVVVVVKEKRKEKEEREGGDRCGGGDGRGSTGGCVGEKDRTGMRDEWRALL